jgi:hypothetical protein
MQTDRPPDSSGVGGDRRDDMDVAAGGNQMTDSRMNHVKLISERISKSHYEVNSKAVAAAIVERLLANNLVPNELRR